MAVPIGSIQLIGEKIVTLPPNRACLPTRAYNKMISWDHLDFSVRISYLESEKLLQVLENVHDGQVTCLCVTADGRYLITGGTDSLICVREMKKIKGERTFLFKKALSGNLAPVRCVAVSRSYSVIVSASEDRTCIVWDLNRLSFVRTLTLTGEAAEYPVSFVSVNNITGNIVVAAGPYLSVFTINGMLLASTKTGSDISAFTMTEAYWVDWMDCDYLTGHMDGSIKVWLLDWVNDERVLSLKLNLKAHGCEVTALHVSADSKRLLSGDKQGKVFQWTEGSVENKP